MSPGLDVLRASDRNGRALDQVVYPSLLIDGVHACKEVGGRFSEAHLSDSPKNVIRSGKVLRGAMH